MLRTPIDFPQMIATAEAVGVDLVKALHVDRKTIWRWRVRDTKPNGDLAIQLWMLAQRIGQGNEKPS